MAETPPPTPVAQPDPASPMSWITELMARVPAHSFMAGLFVYFILVVIPDKENWYWMQIEKQRDQFVAAQKIFEERKEAQIKAVEQECYSSIAESARIGNENRKLIEEIKMLVNQRCDGQPQSR